MSMENGPTLGEMDLARSDLPEYPKIYECTKNDDNFYKTEEEIHCKPFHCKNCRFPLCPFSHCSFTAV